jgi:hypothetical protein
VKVKDLERERLFADIDKFLRDTAQQPEAVDPELERGLAF